MTLPTPEDRPPPTPSVLEYERPVALSPHDRPVLSTCAVVAFATALAGGGVSLAIGQLFFTYRSIHRMEFVAPLIALVGIGLSVHALLRIADRRPRLWGDPLAWAALVLNTLVLLANGCCLTVRFGGPVM